MSPFKERRCHDCGEGTVRLVAKRGRFERFKTMTLEIPADLAIPTCDHCGSEWMDDATANAIDEALERIYRERVQDLVVNAIAAIIHYVPQRSLEEALGLSQGYVSKIRSGAVDVSPQLASQLLLISRDPKNRLRELAELWEQGSGPKS